MKLVEIVRGPTESAGDGHPPVRYMLSDLEEVMVDESASPPHVAPGEVGPIRLDCNPDRLDEVMKQIMDLCENDGTFRSTWNRRRREPNWSASEYDMSLVSQLVAAGADDQTIADAIYLHRVEHNDQPEKKGRRRGYLTGTIGRARGTQAARGGGFIVNGHAGTAAPVSPVMRADDDDDEAETETDNEAEEARPTGDDSGVGNSESRQRKQARKLSLQWLKEKIPGLNLRHVYMSGGGAEAVFSIEVKHDGKVKRVEIGRYEALRNHATFDNAIVRELAGIDWQKDRDGEAKAKRWRDVAVHFRTAAIERSRDVTAAALFRELLIRQMNSRDVIRYPLDMSKPAGKRAAFRVFSQSGEFAFVHDPKTELVYLRMELFMHRFGREHGHRGTMTYAARLLSADGNDFDSCHLKVRTGKTTTRGLRVWFGKLPEVTERGRVLGLKLPNPDEVARMVNEQPDEVDLNPDDQRDGGEVVVTQQGQTGRLPPLNPLV